MRCSFCDRPLECALCRKVYEPPDEAAYHALSDPEAAIDCPECEASLVCYWCQTPYSKLGDEEEGEN